MKWKILKNAILILPEKNYKNLTSFYINHWQNGNFEIDSCVEWQVSFLLLKIIYSKNLIFPKKKNSLAKIKMAFFKPSP